jgi:putative colanic acid biosynthesis glycosyltransferase
MKILQINSVANSGSTGRIAEEIGNVLIAKGHDSFIAYGRGTAKSNSNLIKIGSEKDVYLHGAYTILTDRHAFASTAATKVFIKQIDSIKPDLIALHNLHGYYLNIEILFDYLKRTKIPVVWTLFDCWAFTGHCSYFDDINCTKWKVQCNKCPKYKNYPASWIDNSLKNFNDKNKIFNSIEKMELITHSEWLGRLVQESFLKKYPVNVTPSAINLDFFKPTLSNLRARFRLENKKVILGCASTWSNRKGFNDFLELSKRIDKKYQIVMIGLNDKELSKLPLNIIGLKRTESIEELAQWYSLSFVFVNPTTQDNFPTTNLESLACGTPVITYDTGGSPEAIDAQTGFVVEKGDVQGIVNKISLLETLNYQEISINCRQRAEKQYDKKTRYMDYLEIFERILKKEYVQI